MRVCFQLQVKPDRIEEYRERHREVWPEMLEALASAGWHNYSLFLRSDGLLIGYFETPSLDRALSAMAATEVNERWQAEMAEFFEALDGRRPDEGFEVIDEVFNLDDQLRRIGRGELSGEQAGLGGQTTDGPTTNSDDRDLSP